MVLANLGDVSAEEKPPFAIDLGCGAGNDTLALLQHGWRVLAMDKEQNAIDFLRKRVPGSAQSRFQAQAAPFEGLTLPAADLINASFALPFCHPDHFKVLWAEIVDALGKNGRFSGHLFGTNDQWAANNSHRMTFLTAKQVQNLLKPFQLEHFEEKEEGGHTAIDKPKYWHIFSIVARKR